MTVFGSAASTRLKQLKDAQRQIYFLGPSVNLGPSNEHSEMNKDFRNRSYCIRGAVAS